MSILQNTKIRFKILGLIIILCAVGITSTAFLSSRFKRIDSDYSELLSNDALGLVQITRSQGAFSQTALFLNRLTRCKDDKAACDEARKDFKEAAKRLLERIDVAKTMVTVNVDTIAAIRGKAAEIIELGNGVGDLINRGEQAQAERALTDLGPKIDAMIEDIRAVVDSNMAALIKSSETMSDNTDQSIFGSIAAIGTAFAALFILSLYVIGKGITGPIEALRKRMLSLAEGETQAPVDGVNRGDEIGEMAKAVGVFRDNAVAQRRLEAEADESRTVSDRERRERDAQRAQEAADLQFAIDNLGKGLARLSEGDVGYRIETSFTGALDGLRMDFNESLGKLNEALKAVGDNAKAIDAGAGEIRQAADDLSKRTEQQAASVEETAAALEQITTAVKDSTVRAEEAGALVARARDGAEQSGLVVREAVAAMEQIARSSDEISNIIGVIDEIAFQTNLLALNAGVEAARAGDAGKGFAVVAQEVRELAQRSAQAAKEIKALIATSGGHVDKGVQLVGQTGQALQVIVTEVQEINRHVTAIVEAAREQATGLAEINTAVNQMDQGTQQNAAMVEQSTAASHGLAREVGALNRLLSQFRLTGEAASGQNGPRLADPSERPSASPARALTRKIASAFSSRGGAAAAAAPAQAGWEDF